MATATSTVTLHGRSYRLPSVPTVVVCVDGFDPEYLERAVADGVAPRLADIFVRRGFAATARAAMPSFTNPNNVSIVTGQPPAVHGVAGNFFLDRATGRETPITDASLLRGSTLLARMSAAGVRVAAVTAKDKLRRILAHELQFDEKSGNGPICFSSERAADCTLAEHGIADVEAWLGRPAPPAYSADLSLFVLDAGVRLLEQRRADLLYLTLSDYVQHKHAPGEPDADTFMAALDRRLGKLVDLGAVVAVTGDHGMSAKCKPESPTVPNILFLEDELAAYWAANSARVICPITDPFVRHHGALGSFVRVYLRDREGNYSDVENPLPLIADMADFCRSLPQVERVLDVRTAAAELELPLDREGDLVVIAHRDAVIGSRRDEHDLSAIGDRPLRSHGGFSEQLVPLLLSRPVTNPDQAAKQDWRNFDIFDLALNW